MYPKVHRNVPKSTPKRIQKYTMQSIQLVDNFYRRLNIDMENKKFVIMEKEIARRGLKFYQANCLARSFGNFTTQELKLFDYLTTFIKVEDVTDTVYRTSKVEIVKTLGISKGGKQWKSISEILDKFQRHVVKIPVVKDKNIGIARVNILQKSVEYKSGEIEFQFHPDITEFLFNLKYKGNFYIIPISIIANYKFKPTIILHHLWGATAPRKDSPERIEIVGTLEEFKLWFLGEELREDDSSWGYWTARVFRNKILNKAIAEFTSKQKSITVELITKRQNRQVVGYTIVITQPILQPSQESILVQQIKERAKLLNINSRVTFQEEQDIAYELLAKGLIKSVPKYYKI